VVRQLTEDEQLALKKGAENYIAYKKPYEDME